MAFNNIDASTKDFLARLCKLNTQDNPEKKDEQRNIRKDTQNSEGDNPTHNDEKDPKNTLFGLTPTQLLVVAGIIGGVLDVNSILVDRAQRVQILLEGNLKRPDNGKDSNDLEEILAQIGDKPFDDVIKAMLHRLK